MNCRQSTTDACLSINDEKKLYLLLYVDDLLLLTKTGEAKDWLFNLLGSHVLLNTHWSTTGRYITEVSRKATDTQRGQPTGITTEALH